MGRPVLSSLHRGQAVAGRVPLPAAAGRGRDWLQQHSQVPLLSNRGDWGAVVVLWMRGRVSLLLGAVPLRADRGVGPLLQAGKVTRSAMVHTGRICAAAVRDDCD